MPEAATRGSDHPFGRLVVLPLANISPDPQDEYFADGMTDELISALSRLRGLRTIARTSAMRYKATDKSIAQIGRELDARTVLEGSVRKSGDQLRITVQLVAVATEEPLWSQTFDRSVVDVFAIQREIAQRVARALRVQIARADEGEWSRVATTDVDAYTLYLQGKAHWNLRTEAGLREAVRVFDQALAKDPRFPLALAGKADAYAALAVLEFSPPTDSFPKAREAAERALAVDDRSAEARASLGLVKFQYERDWEGAERELRRAVELNPNYPAAHQYLADYLKAMGRFDEATAEMHAALDLDPLSMAISTGLGHVLYLSRKYDEAIAQYRRALELDPKFVLAHLWFGRPYLQTGRYDEAIAEIRQAVQLSAGSTMALAVLAHALASAGKSEEARTLLAELIDRARARYLPSYWIALVHTGLGDDAEALRWLERAFDERSSWLVWIGVEPRFDRLRTQPAFRTLLRRMRLAEADGPGSDSGPPRTRPPAELVELLSAQEGLRLTNYRVVGSYTRHGSGVRHALKDFRQRVADCFQPGAQRVRDNFLLWGAPGAGKTFLVREVARSLGDRAELRELNLAELDEGAFRSGLDSVARSPRPMVCFVDEVDSKPGEPWPYEAMLPLLDLESAAAHPRVFVLAGSSGTDPADMKRRISARPKGTDLLSRIPHENEVTVPALAPADRVLVAASTIRDAALRSHRTVAEVEKLALYYLASEPELANPRQLRDRVRLSVERLGADEDRFRFDLLFHPGDPGNKEFWMRARSDSPQLLGEFVRLEE